MKYILTIAFAFFIFTGNVKAAPLHAYYCFNALETANNVVSAFDGFLNSSSGEDSSSSGKISFSGSQKVPLSPVGSQLEIVSKEVSRV